MQATQPQKSCHALQPQNMDTDDKLVLSPIVFQGTYNYYLIFTFVKKNLAPNVLQFRYQNLKFCKPHEKKYQNLLSLLYSHKDYK